MRTYNIIEYKNPKDGMNIDDFAKPLGDALLYKGYGKKVNQVPMEELSVSMVRAVYPRDMFAQLRKQGHEIVENFEVYEEIRRNSVMCEALRRLMKDEIELERQAGRQAGRKEGREEGRKEGENQIIFNMNKKGYTIEQIADVTDKDVEEVKAILENREPALV